MKNRFGQSAAFSSTSTADLLENQQENYQNDQADGEVVAEAKGLQLEKQVGLLGSVSLIVGTMIGSGIFASASGVFSQAGSVGLSLIVCSCLGRMRCDCDAGSPLLC